MKTDSLFINMIIKQGAEDLKHNLDKYLNITNFFSKQYNIKEYKDILNKDKAITLLSTYLRGKTTNESVYSKPG